MLAWRVRRLDRLTRPAAVLAALLLAQFATGLVNVVFAWPLVAAVLHNAGAAALIATLVVINYRLPRSTDASAFPARKPFIQRSAMAGLRR